MCPAREYHNSEGVKRIAVKGNPSFALDSIERPRERGRWMFY